MSGSVRAAPRTSPSFSAIIAQSSSRTGFRSLAWKSTSASVTGTKPQFVPPGLVVDLHEARHLRLQVALVSCCG